jgi:hypothetical protein
MFRSPFLFSGDQLAALCDTIAANHYRIMALSERTCNIVGPMAERTADWFSREKNKIITNIVCQSLKHTSFSQLVRFGKMVNGF